MKPTEEQLKFINYEGTNSLILSSTAGSGKSASCVERLNKMLLDGLDPSRVIFFSYTNDAVNELKSRIKHDVKICTIHSFTSSVLGKLGLYKPIITFFDFTKWYREKKKPQLRDSLSVKEQYAKNLDVFYEDSVLISTLFSSFKLQIYDGIRMPRPQYYNLYEEFINETKTRDFADMLIDVERLSRDPGYKAFFNRMYDYVFVDEYQDTSTLQMKILLSMNAKQYHLVGDIFQSIFGFSGANCLEIERLLKEKYTVETFTLTKNFRSYVDIVDNGNKYSDLKAIPHHKQKGKVHQKLIDEDTLYNMMEDGEPLTVLCRTNYTVKELEKYGLKHKIKMRYFNFITPQDIEKVQSGEINPSLKKRLEAVAPYHLNTIGLLKFIEDNKTSNTFATTIHKSKGREFPRCVVINSVDPELLVAEDMDSKYSYINDNGNIDIEARNVHYVAVTRPIKELYFLVIDED